MTEPRSPLRDKPLHVPGQSLDDTINRLWDDKGLHYMMVFACFVGVAVLDWLRWIRQVPPQPLAATVLAIAATAYSLLGLFRLRRQTKRLELGRDGERAVAEVLDGLREQGCRVFHDIVGNGFNVDHVVLAPQGIFVVETKTVAKPARKRQVATVKATGGRIIAGGADLGSHPIDQTKAAARWVSDLLKESSGKTYPVKPCLVFPGWFVERMTKETKREIWVLHPKGLVAFIQNEKVCIRPEDLHLAAYHLSSYIRSPWAAGDGGFARKLSAKKGKRVAPAASAK